MKFTYNEFVCYCIDYAIACNMCANEESLLDAWMEIKAAEYDGTIEELDLDELDKQFDLFYWKD